MKPRKTSLLVWLIPVPLVAWGAALMAQALPPGIPLDAVLPSLTQTLKAPLSLRWTERTGAFLAGGILLYAMIAAVYIVTRGNRRPGEEHGTARWGNPQQLCRKYHDRRKSRNILLTKHVRMGMNTHRHRRNLNVLVVGGSGAGKTRFYALPNVMQANCSYVVTDPKGELLANTGPLLQSKGYKIRVLNLTRPEQSDFYNPFRYIREDKDVLRLINMLIKNTNPKSAKTDDPFWEKSETALLMALMFYLLYEAPANEQNFATVMYLIENADVREDDEDYQSALDLLFLELEDTAPEHIAVKFYHIFKQAAGKTAKSILVSAAVRLAPFNLPEVAYITNRDTMEIGRAGDELTAIFCVIPDSDASLNFLVSLFYSQLFSEFYLIADSEKKRRLKIPIRLMMDEFPNIPVPGGEDFPRILATMRSREISANIIVQNISQLKALFRDEWENIVGNCDTLLYLGGNEQSTHKYLSELLGKATIDTQTSGLTKGAHGSSSENYQNIGRELMTPDEVRLLDNRYALLFVRGERPIMDEKYPLEKHANYPLTEAGGQSPYIHHPTQALDDLPFAVDSLDDIDFFEPEGGEEAEDDPALFPYDLDEEPPDNLAGSFLLDEDENERKKDTP